MGGLAMLEKNETLQRVKQDHYGREKRNLPAEQEAFVLMGSVMDRSPKVAQAVWSPGCAGIKGNGRLGDPSLPILGNFAGRNPAPKKYIVISGYVDMFFSTIGFVRIPDNVI